jgi:hypothetical protein
MSKLIEFLDEACGKGVSTNASCLYSQEISLVLISVARTQGHSAAGKIKSIKYSDCSGNQTRDLPACSAVPQPTARSN